MPKRPIHTVWLSLSKDGEPVMLDHERIYADDHDYVRARPELFEEITIIEQATAAPGERRNTVRR